MGSIYLLTNKVNGKKYVGKTERDVSLRFHEHVRDCQKYNRPLGNAILKYGSDNFILEVLEVSEDPNILNTLESEYIRKYDCCILDGADKGYNLTRGGEGIGSEVSSLIQRKRLKAGTHHLQGDKGSKHNQANQKRRVAEGIHPWSGDRGKEMNRKMMESGTHISSAIQTCPHCGRQGRNPGMRLHIKSCISRDREGS